jgi:DNA repair protein RecN (Recombination protein N)
MITSLHISNYAIIDHIDLNLNEGLSVITGETGAGKSILLGALGLVLGNRADSQVLYNSAEKCIVEVIFEIEPYKLQKTFLEEDLDYDHRCIIRREINTQGKSRAFINDTPTTLAVLKRITQNLVDLHQQFDTLEINQEQFQIEVIDALGNDQRLLEEYKSEFNAFSKNQRELKRLTLESEEAAKEMDFLQFQVDELEKLNLQEGELSEIEKEYQRVQNGEEIKQVGGKIADTLENGDYSIHASLTELYKSVEKLSEYDASASSISERLFSIREEISDIAQEASIMAENADFDEESLQVLEEKLNEINRLITKHRVQTDVELIAIYNEYSGRLDSFQHTDKEIEILKEKINAQEKELVGLANTITIGRQKNAKILEKEVKEKLNDLSMPNAELKIEIKGAERFRNNGKDIVEFLFTANKGSALLPLHKVASGGELSRLNLAIKSIVAGAITLPSLIFDEIDTGVSGNVSLRMGKLLKVLSKKHQTIVITHSPQIAALADHHFFIYKFDEKDRTMTGMKVLETSEKKEEIAKMLSGDPPSIAALKNAEDLMALK